MRIRTIVLGAAMSIACGGFAMADLTGTVKFDGEAPEPKEIDMGGVPQCAQAHADPVYDDTLVVGDNGELANVVVAIKREDSPDLEGDVPSEPAVLDQEGCMYEPHVIAMMAGQTLIVKNSDPFLHNVHSMAEINPNFNFGQPNKDPGKKVESPKAEETFRVKCDVHPWMSAYIAVFDHPFFAVSDEEGKFAIKNLPDGDYTVVAWHEKLGRAEEQVTIADGKGEVEFSGGAAAAPSPAINDVVLASTSGEKKACCGTGCDQKAEAATTADAK
jgi:plastocyanin